MISTRLDELSQRGRGGKLRLGLRSRRILLALALICALLLVFILNAEFALVSTTSSSSIPSLAEKAATLLPHAELSEEAWEKVEPQLVDGVEEDEDDEDLALPQSSPLPKPLPPPILPSSPSSSLSSDSFLPLPQLRFFPHRNANLPRVPLRFQMHNCLRGRDGSKVGLRESGVSLVQIQKRNIQAMPLHYIDDASAVVLSCNAKAPVFRLTRDSRANGKRLISTAQGLLNYLCLGSTKARQLECRRDLAAHWGCDFEELGIQPRQYILDKPRECEQFLAIGSNTTTQTSWLSKPSGGIRGRGIKYFATTALLQLEIGQIGCSHSNATGIRGRIAQEYVAAPALIDSKYKFDVRTWLLVASVDPLLVFYHEGFARVARQAYSVDSRSKMVHITNAFGQLEAKPEANNKYMRTFDEINEDLSRNYNLGADFMHNSFRKQMMRAQAYAALAQFQLESRYHADILHRRKGFYQIYACDSMVDVAGRAHLLECNGFPAESQQTAVTGKQIWSEMMALLLNLHLEPWNLLNRTSNVAASKFVKEGIWAGEGLKMEHAHQLKAYSYAFGGWHLVFNELETPSKAYNVCQAFGATQL